MLKIKKFLDIMYIIIYIKFIIVYLLLIIIYIRIWEIKI